MRYGCDTNVLIYAHLPSLPDHEKVRAHLLRLLADREVTVAITGSILHEFVHVVTDSRRFQPPVSMAEALAVARQYLGRANVECLSVDEEAVRLAFELIERHNLGRRRIADTLFAATLLRNGIDRLVTCDPADFRTFDGLAVVDPRSG